MRTSIACHFFQAALCNIMLIARVPMVLIVNPINLSLYLWQQHQLSLHRLQGPSINHSFHLLPHPDLNPLESDEKGYSA
jgi:hypothetical protein